MLEFIVEDLASRVLHLKIIEDVSKIRDLSMSYEMMLGSLTESSLWLWND